MKTIEYLDRKMGQFSELSTSLYTNQHNFIVGYDHVSDEIFRRLTSKKFRKLSLAELQKSHIKGAINQALENGEPIRFIYPFGGYKMWRLPTAPSVDWAEYFSVTYCLEYLISVAAIYEPGVELIFSSDDYILERMNNLPRNDVDSYLDSFIVLIDFMKEYLPPNISIKLVRTCDLYSDKDELEDELSREYASARSYYGFSQERFLERDISVAMNNIQWNGSSDLRGLSRDEKKRFAEESLYWHGAYTHLSRRLQYNRSSTRIAVSPVSSESAIVIGSTRRSTVKFWTGTGVLKEVGEKTKADIISVRKLEENEYTRIRTSESVVANKLENDNFNYIIQIK